MDDKYPIQLVTDKIASRISHAMRSPEVSGLLFCRCRVTLNNPKLALYPHKVRNPFGDIYFERKAWFQIWIHQLLRAKVLRYLFTHLPDHIPSAKAMDELKTTYRSWLSTGYLSPKRTSQSLERAQRGVITQNCYESMLASGIKLPEWFQHPNGEYITLENCTPHFGMVRIIDAISSLFAPQKSSRTNQRVVIFTTHRAGSMLLHWILRDICQKHHITYYSPNQAPDKQLPFEQIFRGEDFIAKRSGCFGPLRFFVPSAALDTAKIILHLRDPRDVLTSMFFSYCFMHPGEIEANTGYRKEVAEAGIDKFALDMSDEDFARYKGDYGTGLRYGRYVGNIRDRYITYLREVASRPNAIVISYEQMVLDFRSWLQKFLSAFELPGADGTYQFVANRRAESVKPVGEDIRSHMRKVTPGDYREKLRPETIAELNRRFSEVLDALGYSSPRYEAKHLPSIVK